jgi:cell division protein FtsB
MFQKIKESGIYRILSNKFLITGVLFLVWVLFFDSNSLTDWYKVRRNVVEQERQIKYYRHEIISIDKQLNELNSNLDSLEKFARERYFFKMPDEEIFVTTPSIPVNP